METARKKRFKRKESNTCGYVRHQFAVRVCPLIVSFVLILYCATVIFLQAQIALISGDIVEAKKRATRPVRRRGSTSFSSPSDGVTADPASSPASGEDRGNIKKQKMRHDQGSTTSASEKSSPSFGGYICQTGSGGIPHRSWSKDELDTMASAVENETGFSHQT